MKGEKILIKIAAKKLSQTSPEISPKNHPTYPQHCSEKFVSNKRLKSFNKNYPQNQAH
jgi:ribosomal protein L31